MTVVNGGILEDYFFDLYSATKAKRTSNGHGIKASLGALARPAATNFYMKQGKTSPDEMLKSSKQVFLLRDVMGLHMADLITGEFSLGASGILYENGKFKQAVRGVTIAGQLGSILKDVSAVGSDLTWYGATGAPSFLLPQVTIAGN
jgi:PmbA protein